MIQRIPGLNVRALGRAIPPVLLKAAVPALSSSTRVAPWIRASTNAEVSGRACGTGAFAAVAVSRLGSLVDLRVTGTVHIDRDGPGHALAMTGSAMCVFEAERMA
ncbi:MAG: hypothetical protein ABI389_12205 [Rhodanobacter sp.]